MEKIGIRGWCRKKIRSKEFWTILDDCVEVIRNDQGIPSHISVGLCLVNDKIQACVLALNHWNWNIVRNIQRRLASLEEKITINSFNFKHK